MSPMTNSSARKRHENTTPKETPVSKHPETTTEWLEDIALELHAITGLLNERLPVVHPGGQPSELNNDDPDEALAKAMYERADVDEPGTWPPSHPDDLAHWMRLARAAREHIADWRGDEVERLREGIRVSLNESRDMQSEMRSSVTLAYLQCELDELLDPTEGETDADA